MLSATLGPPLDASPQAPPQSAGRLKPPRMTARPSESDLGESRRPALLAAAAAAGTTCGAHPQRHLGVRPRVRVATVRHAAAAAAAAATTHGRCGDGVGQGAGQLVARGVAVVIRASRRGRRRRRLCAAGGLDLRYRRSGCGRRRRRCRRRFLQCTNNTEKRDMQTYKMAPYCGSALYSQAIGTIGPIGSISAVLRTVEGGGGPSAPARLPPQCGGSDDGRQRGRPPRALCRRRRRDERCVAGQEDRCRRGEASVLRLLNQIRRGRSQGWMRVPRRSDARQKLVWLVGVLEVMWLCQLHLP